MKKLFMTAIALIAFNGVSMGNTNVTNYNLVLKNNKSVAVERWYDCIGEAVHKMEQYEQVHGCLTGEQYDFRFKQFFNQCQNRDVPAIIN
jgi:hypothetical protein